MGGMRMTEKMTEAELADHYNETMDVSDFDQSTPEPVTVKRATSPSRCASHRRNLRTCVSVPMKLA